MNNLLYKLRANLARFMAGRYGSDQLSLALVVASVVVTLIGSFSGLRLLALVADAMCILAFFRMLSKNRYARAHENQIYMEKTQNIRRIVSEWWNRMKNRKQYHYYSCPKCKKRLRVPRGVGQVTITCRDCGTKFDKKA